MRTLTSGRVFKDNKHSYVFTVHKKIHNVKCLLSAKFYPKKVKKNILTLRACPSRTRQGRGLVSDPLPPRRRYFFKYINFESPTMKYFLGFQFLFRVIRYSGIGSVFNGLPVLFLLVYRYQERF